MPREIEAPISLPVMDKGASAQLHAIITRVENLEAQIRELNSEKADIMAEAKACGFDRNTIRAVIRRRKLQADIVAEQDALVDLYEAIASEGPPKKDESRRQRGVPRKLYGPDIEGVN